MATNPLNRRPSTKTGQNAKPPNGISVQGPEVVPIRVGRQIGHQKPDQTENCDDPAIATILANARTQIPATEERYARHEDYDRKRNKGRVGKEGLKPTPAKDSQAKIGESRHHGDEC
jgi:hypothetical protein